MPQFRVKKPEPFEALILPNGDYAFVAYGKLTTMAKGEFEGTYEAVPFVPAGVR
jgi:hypothetical protein